MSVDLLRSRYGAGEEGVEVISRVGIFLPINQKTPTIKPPIPEPDDDELTLTKRGNDWGIFWTIADEEGVVPEVAASLTWLVDAVKGVARRHISAHGFQTGLPLLVTLNMNDDCSLPDIYNMERHDWATNRRVP